MREASTAGQKWPTLYKRTTSGGVQLWEVSVAFRDDDTADVVMVYGLVGGAKTTKTDHVAEGKNAGKKNATTAYQQAVAEAEARWVKQQERHHYGRDLDANESAEKRSAAPMLAESYKKWDKKQGKFLPTTHAAKVLWDDPAYPKFAQPKLDGNRCLYRGGKLWSRKGEDLSPALPHLIEALESIDARLLDGMTALDGELYAHAGHHVTAISGWIRGRKPEALGLEYHIYDADIDAPFAERERRISNLFRKSLKLPACLVRVRTATVLSEDEMFEFQAECLDQGYEGAMLRHGHKGYENTRSDSLLKFKVWEDDEFEVVGFKPADRDPKVCVFQCVTAAGHPFDATAPGNRDQKWAYLLDGPAHVGRMLTIKYAGYTVTAKPVPFHLTAIGFKDEEA